MFVSLDRLAGLAHFPHGYAPSGGPAHDGATHGQQPAGPAPLLALLGAVLVCFPVPEGRQGGKEGAGLAAGGPTGPPQGRGVPRGLPRLWPCGPHPRSCPGPWGTSQSACSVLGAARAAAGPPRPWRRGRQESGRSRVHARGLRCGTWMASGSWERDRVGLEARGGSSDFWATDGSLGVQRNRRLVSTYCVLVSQGAQKSPAALVLPIRKRQLFLIRAPLPPPTAGSSLSWRRDFLSDGNLPSAKWGKNCFFVRSLKIINSPSESLKREETETLLTV